MKQKLFKLFSVLMMIGTFVMVTSCTEEVDVDLPGIKNGVSSLIDMQVIAPSDLHQNGGVMLLIGLDNDGNGTLSQDEVTFQFPIWHGNDGSNGQDAVAPTISIVSGYWYINGENTGIVAEGKDGADGSDGADGIAGTQITISEDGYWIIDGVKTDIKAEGKDGKDGSDGLTLTPIFVNTDIPPTANHTNGGILVTVYVDKDQESDLDEEEIVGMYTVWHGNDGQDGADGLSPYVGEDGYWYVGEYNTGVFAFAPTIEIINGIWFIDGESTGVTAVGQDGSDGQDGQDGSDGADGVSPTVQIINGVWFINGQSTGVEATGADGQDGSDGADGSDGQDGSDGADGQDGKSPYIGQDGFWYTWNGSMFVNSGVEAKGDKGDKGDRGTVVGYTVNPDKYGLCENGGYTISVTLDSQFAFDFTLCNGIDGEVGPAGPAGQDGKDGSDGQDGQDGSDGQDGQDGQDGDDCSCEECFPDCDDECCVPVFGAVLKNFNLVEQFNNNTRPVTWSYGAFSFRTGYNNVLLGSTHSNFTGNYNFITTEPLKAAVIDMVGVDVSSTSSSRGHEYRAILIHFDGTETVLPVKQHIGSGTSSLKWWGEWYNVCRVRFEAATIGGNANFRPIVNKVHIKGTKFVN